MVRELVQWVRGRRWMLSDAFGVDWLGVGRSALRRRISIFKEQARYVAEKLKVGNSD